MVRGIEDVIWSPWAGVIPIVLGTLGALPSIRALFITQHGLANPVLLVLNIVALTMGLIAITMGFVVLRNVRIHNRDESRIS